MPGLVVYDRVIREMMSCLLSSDGQCDRTIITVKEEEAGLEASKEDKRIHQSYKSTNPLVFLNYS